MPFHNFKYKKTDQQALDLNFKSQLFIGQNKKLLKAWFTILIHRIGEYILQTRHLRSGSRYYEKAATTFVTLKGVGSTYSLVKQPIRT